ncbi:TetR/AcrR family transcriptional regulator [Leptospira sarikeiensis]|uniref:TetR/AcrR family transcriptional regulator n=1 Tax=Leptospira sarikeiensis TaxID=2484943 RepID=A0A4R9K8A4_9LEPT|nr:TetR/AcrR family transcriptional regulator [Leptospira sarikeiensis]TGL61696.1 TetR/AcrR family transcriptional regulator [Leptospira sarikeiensis]
MGHSQSNKIENHDKIVRIAANRFRELGVNGVGVDGLMKEAGLTHGGFYRHFSSKDELIAEAIERALEDGGAKVLDSVSKGEKITLESLIQAYLSRIHRDRLESSCAVTTLATDVIRSNEKARSAYTRQVGRYLDLLNQLISGNEEEVRKKAISTLSTLVGALSMARAVNDKKLSREILRSATEDLLERLK